MRSTLNYSQLGILNQAAGAFLTSGDSSSLKTNGQIALLDSASRVVDPTVALAVTDKNQYQIGIFEGGRRWLSNMFVPANLEDVTPDGDEEFIAATQQLSYVGFSGVAGTAIDVSNETLYTLMLEQVGKYSMFSKHPQYLSGSFTSSAAATQEEIAITVAKNIGLTLAIQPERVVKVEAICDEAGTDQTVLTGDITATYGSPFVQASVDIDGEDIAIGAYLRIGGVTTTDGLYKVVGLDTTNDIAELDQPFQGETATYGAATCNVVASAAGLAAEWGLKIQGIERTNFTEGLIHYDVPSFKIDRSIGFGSITPLTNSVASSEGRGEGKAVVEAEWEMQGEDKGYLYKVSDIPVPVRKVADVDINYDILNLRYSTKTDTNIGGVISMNQETVLAVNELNAAGGGAVASLQAIFANFI